MVVNLKIKKYNLKMFKILRPKIIFIYNFYKIAILNEILIYITLFYNENKFIKIKIKYPNFKPHIKII